MACLAASALTLGVPAGTATLASDDTMAAADSTPAVAKPLPPKQYQQRLLHQVNRARANHDRHRVALRACLDGFANPWARTLARREKLIYRDLIPMAKKCNLISAGELIARGSVTPRRIVQTWLKVPAQRKVLLNPKFRLVGVGAARSDNSGWYVCVDFGRR
jgi:uncharacterized protein YkwD